MRNTGSLLRSIGALPFLMVACPLILGACTARETSTAAEGGGGAGGGGGGGGGGGEADSDTNAAIPIKTGGAVDEKCMSPEGKEGAPLASLGKCGKLVYNKYANRGEAEVVNRLPDFSFAGYAGGGVPIPKVPVVATVDPGPGDDHDRIQKAIDTVSKLPVGADGFRGAVLLHKGSYEVGTTLVIEADGVVLRGEGQGTTGTVITATAKKQYTLIEARGTGSGTGEVPGTRTPISTKLVPVGARKLEVESAAGFAVGQRIVIEKQPNQKWIDALKMGPYGWAPSEYVVGNERTIVAIDGDQITVDEPLVDAIETKYGGGEVYRSKIKGRVRHVAVEDMRLDSSYSGPTDEDHGWTAIALSRAQDSWVQRVTVLHFGLNAVALTDYTVQSTVQDVAHLDPISEITGGRRYPFYVDKGTNNLFQRCYSRNGRHSFVSGAHVAGPNVWLDCLAEDTHADDGPHHRFATGLLFDNIRGGQLKVQNRKDSGSGHGWSGAQVLFWNSQADTIVCDAPIGAMSWTIGGVGTKSQGDWAPEEPFGYWESHGQPVSVRSLYLQQLQDRLGAKAVENVTAKAQRDGRIWKALSDWAGKGKLSSYL